MNKKFAAQNSEAMTSQLFQPFMAKYQVVVANRGLTSEINHFTSLEEAKQALGEIAHDYGYEPGEINGSGYYDVSIWEWTEDRYEKIYYYS